ncbi:MAG: phage holin family protein [Atopobiaceae bacterium]|nr:phage holin family protein [Atopobiaceae bacterium]
MPFPDNLIAAFAALNATWFILAFAAICFDLLTGFIIKGVIPHNVQSSIMREGLVHKSWEVAIILCAAMIDIAISAGMGIDMQPMSAVTCAFIFVMESASVCENALEGNPELASAPVIKYVSKAKQEAASELDDTNDLGRHLRG